MEDLIKISEVNKLLGVELKTIRDWVRRGFLLSEKIGRYNYIRRSDLESVLAQFASVRKYEKLLAAVALKQQQLLDEYDRTIRQVQEDMFLVSTMGHVLNTKKFFSAVIKTNALPQIESDVLSLMIEGNSFNEIAQKLQISNQVVRQRFNKALDKMQRFKQTTDILNENTQLKHKVSANDKLIEQLITENNRYRSGNITGYANSDYVFTMYFFLRRRLKHKDFSLRTYNALERAGICTIGDLVKLHLSDIYKIKGIRKKCSEEIKAYAHRLGFTLGFNVEEINKQYKQIYGQVS